MARRRRWQSYDEPAYPELVEWLVVTLILAIAFFAILQVVGDDLRRVVTPVWEAVLAFFAVVRGRFLLRRPAPIY